MTSTPETERTQGAGTSIAVACIATVMLMLDISVVNTALNDISHGLDTGLSGLQWVIDAYTLPLAAVVLTAGSIADRFGRKKLFLQGMVVFTAASALCAAAPGISTLVTARAVQGLGAAVLFATALALISEVTPTPESRAKALGIFGAAIGASFAVGPFIGGTLTEWVSWRAIFWINVPIGIVCLLLSRRVHESSDPNARKVDIPGQIALIGGMFLLVFALLRGNEDGWDSTKVIASLVGAGVFLVGFGVIEHLSQEPMLPLTLFRQARFTGPQVVVVGISATFFAGFLYATLYLQQVVGLSPIRTGLAYLPGTFLVFVVSGASAGLLTRVKPAILATIGLVFIAAGVWVMGLNTEVDSGWSAILPGLLIASVGCGLVNPSGSALALEALPPEQSGLASGASDTFRQTGVAVGIAWLGTYIPAGSAFAPDKNPFVDGMHNAFDAAAIFALVCAIGTGLLLLRRDREPAGDATAVAEPA
ncbi:MFS transporter [Nocardioides marmorisolisilvae]|uniref:DHA2 family efflux MFS transporter permease subunit n=1 Tax=Nocardioides marmorisolisilvae TaxID=1542737 RepID=A0A3N0DWY2_9ACTN|nr:MFS transporter [Nocardioides marmorisolisilvae]RNL80006.1 DHA2 family efflux MFS transporter permease subunit [Nocardioides marmorisolisilvae]